MRDGSSRQRSHRGEGIDWGDVDDAEDEGQRRDGRWAEYGQGYEVSGVEREGERGDTSRAGKRCDGMHEG